MEQQLVTAVCLFILSSGVTGQSAKSFLYLLTFAVIWWKF